MDAASFDAQSDGTLPLLNIKGTGTRGVVDIWNAAYEISFFKYREQLAAIAADSHERVEGAILTRGLENFEEWLSSDEEEIIVPTDDDDFFRPNLETVKKAFDANTDIVIWTFADFGFLPAQERGIRATEKSFRTMRWNLLGSNNWAIRKSYVAHFPVHEAQVVLAHHAQGHKLIADDLGIPQDVPAMFGLRLLNDARVRVIDDVYSLYNSHVGSIYVLAEILRNQKDPVAFLRSLDHVKPTDVPAYAQPFEPYIRRFEALSRTLVPQSMHR